MTEYNESLRCTGRTTGLVLRVLADAIENAGHWIVARDHWNMICAHNNVAELARNIGLEKGFSININHHSHSIKVEPRKV